MVMCSSQLETSLNEQFMHPASILFRLNISKDKRLLTLVICGLQTFKCLQCFFHTVHLHLLPLAPSSEASTPGTARTWQPFSPASLLNSWGRREIAWVPYGVNDSMVKGQGEPTGSERFLM